MQHRADTPSGPPLNDQRALTRAGLALRCLPFRRAFYDEVTDRALSSTALCSRNDASSLCRRELTPDRAEADWIWLIQLGVLRREVDGQGLTERVRLTPMGRELLVQWPGEIPEASLVERIQHGVRRRRPRL